MAPVHVVCLSGGKDSTAMALRLAEINPGVAYRYVITPTGNELPEMDAHWALLERMLGAKLERLPAPTLEALMAAQGALPSTRMRWCTRMIKIAPVRVFYAGLPRGSVAYVGLRADEEERGGLFGDGIIQSFPLRQWGWGLAEVTAYLKARGVSIPSRTDCAFCPFQSADNWFTLWRDHPDVFARAEGWERAVGHTFRSPTAKHGRWAVALEDMRAQFEAGMLTREEVRRRSRLAVLPGVDDVETACRVCRL